VIVDSALYHQGARVDVDCHPHEFDKLRDRARSEEGDFVWVGLYKPSESELGEVARAFGLHRLAVEDALGAHQRPKLDRYDDSLFIVLKTLWYVDADDQVETGEINLFVGADFVVSVRHGRGSELHSARQRLESHQRLLHHGPSAVVYAVCDTVVDRYVEVMAELQVDVDEVEESVFSPARTNDSIRIYTLKREIAEVRRAVMPLREPLRLLSTDTVELVHHDAGPFFRDVADHLAQVAGIVEDLDTLLSTAFDAHVARIQLQQNDDTRKISAGVALVAGPTLIAGIYGMNFSYMPELDWRLGYPVALLLMAAISLGLWVFFKRSGWL
jgi:magnesium transporter